MNLDSALFHLVNNLVGTWAPLDWLARLLVNDYAVPSLCALLLGGLWFAGDTPEERSANQRAVLFAVLGLGFANALIKDIQAVYFRPRPFAVEEVNLLFYRPSVSSFPSVPVATLFAWTAAVRYFNRAAGNLLFILSSAFALARLYAGVHYPLDLIGGAAIGTAMSLIPIRLALFQSLTSIVVRSAQKLSLA